LRAIISRTSKKAGAAELAIELGHTNASLVFQHYRELAKSKEGKRYWSIVPQSEGANIIPLIGLTFPDRIEPFSLVF
jgi:hypothetical protein